MDRAPLFGATTLSTIDVGFPVSRTLTPSALGAPAPNVGILWMKGQDLAGLREAFGAEDESAADVALRLFQETADDLNERAERISQRLDTLRTRVRADPAERARLSLLVDSSWVPVARTVAGDSAPTRIRSLVDSLNTARLESIAPARYYSARALAVRYGRAVDALRLIMPVDQLAGVSDSSSVPQLLMDIADDISAYRRSEATLATLSASIRAMRLTEAQGRDFRDGAPPGQLPPLLVAGMDIGEILRTPAALRVRIDMARNVVSDVNRATGIVAGAMTLLPRWTVNPDSQTVMTRIYPSESDVKIVVLRRDRFAPWTAASGGAAAPKAAPAQTSQTTSANATTVTTVTTVTPPASGTTGGSAKPADSNAPAGGAGPVTAFSTLTPPMGSDTVAVLSIPVLQRYRFHLGVGMLYSTLKTTAFEVRADTVEGQPGERVLQIGTDRNRLLPVAILSYTLLPLEGRFVDARARRYPWQNPSLQIQGGLALQNPTEQLYGGVAAELFPGLETGIGFHWAYVQTSERANGEFVAFATGPATSNQWKRGTAYTVTLDATTFVKAFGGLLGI
jgi:hypothetical protein